MLEAVNQASQPPSGEDSTHPVGNNRGLKQAYDIRDFSAQCALELREVEANTLEEMVARARALKDATSTWFSASERIRLLRGTPLPGSRRPSSEPKRKRKEDVSPMPEDNQKL